MNRASATLDQLVIVRERLVVPDVIELLKDADRVADDLHRKVT